jgi:RNA polymerase sigma factor (sigma-70 family)
MGRLPRDYFHSRHLLEFENGREGPNLMPLPNPVREDDLDLAFQESSDIGVHHLHSEYREQVYQRILRAARGHLNRQELLVVYQDTIAGVIERTRGPDFDPFGSLRMVYTIARNKTVDFLRDRKKHRIPEDHDAILDQLAARTRYTDLGLRWRQAIGPAEAKELREILLKFFPTLPERQRVVAQCYVDNFGDFRPRDIFEPLAAAVSAVTGITESAADVKNDWRYAKEKIIAHLQGLGYNIFTRERSFYD